MAVYVDHASHAYGRMIMCHLLADSTEELFAAADAIGVQRKWIQNAGTPAEHFDICQAKRALAVKAGAIEVTSRQLVQVIRGKRAASALAPGAVGK
jgi:hypothetical protein